MPPAPFRPTRPSDRAAASAIATVPRFFRHRSGYSRFGHWLIYLNWTSANELCRTRSNGNLATIASEADNDEILQIMDGMPGGAGHVDWRHTMCRCRRPRGAGRVAAAPFRASSRTRPTPMVSLIGTRRSASPRRTTLHGLRHSKERPQLGVPSPVPPSTPLLDPLSSAGANGLRPTAHSAYCDMPSARK